MKARDLRSGTTAFSGLKDRINTRKRILVCAGRYLPGYKSGGPVRSIANLVAYLGGRFDFYVLTRDRDVGDEQRYPHITADRWSDLGKARVWYCSSIHPSIILRAFREAQPDLIYLNSFQDAFTRIVVSIRKLGKFGEIPLLLAPRGEFSHSAMEIKRTKKVIYRCGAKLLGLHENLHWHATSANEKADVLRAAPATHLDSACVYLASNICDARALPGPHPAKETGRVKLAFVARMSEMKNLQFLIGILPGIHGQVELDLFGPVGEGDAHYWSGCLTQIRHLPANICVRYQGSIDHSLVPQVLHDHHFFVLPTKGENFCHAAVESFVNGTPAVLSNETPWIELGKEHAGFDISLEDRQAWTAALQACADMGQADYTSYVSGAREFGRQFSMEQAVKAHEVMFEAAMQRSSSAPSGM